MAERDKKKAVVFEYARGRHLPLIRWYLWRGYEVYFVNPETIQRSEKSLFELERSRQIQRLAMREPLYHNNNPAADLAFEVNDTVYDNFYRNVSSAAKRMSKLYRSEDVHLAFKKHLLVELKDYFHCQLLRRQLDDLLSEKRKIIVIPHHINDAVTASVYDRTLEKAGMADRVYKGRVEFPLWGRLLGSIIAGRRKLRLVALCVHTMVKALFGYARSFRKRIQRKAYPFGIGVVSPVREFANEVRGVDVLLDGQKLRKDNTLFVPLIPLKKNHAQAMKEKGLIVANGMAPSRGVVKDVLTNGATLLTRIFSTPTWLATVNAYLVKDYLVWSRFQSRYKLDNFVTYADSGFNQVSRNILLKQNGAKTWYYLDTENLGALQFKGSDTTPPHKHHYWGYLYYDHCVTWSQRLIDYYEMHKQKIGRYVSVGCLWSEHIRQVREGEIPSRLLERLVESGYQPGQKLVAVYDSTYHNLSRTTYFDGVAFAQGIEKLIDDVPDIFVVWKEKKNRLVWKEKQYKRFHLDEGSSELASIYDRLGEHPRCFFAGYDSSSAEVSALCDLTISFPFTSTSIEALGAGAKAIFYLPNAKFSNSYVSKTPDLAAYQYEALCALVEKLLFNTPDAEYQNYLEKYIKGEIEPYLDGRGLTRFRQLLSESAEESPLPTKVGHL